MSSALIGWGTGAHFELAYHQIAHCTYSLNLYLLAYCLSIRLAPITHFSAQFANQELLPLALHIIFSSHCHAHWILYTALLAQREFEAQGKIPIVPLSDLQVGNIYIGHMIASV